jgi:colicin import membrane protein
MKPMACASAKDYRMCRRVCKSSVTRRNLAVSLRVSIGAAGHRAASVITGADMLLENRENSVLFSLRELRDIEHDRVRAEQERRRQAVEAERRRIEDERLRLEAERQRREQEERMRLEEQERQRREEELRLQAAEQHARIAALAAIEQQRMENEMELRRQEISRKRPTWLLAVVGVLIVLGGSLGVWARQTAVDGEQVQLHNRELAAEIDMLEVQMKDVRARLAAATTAEARAAAQAQLDTTQQQLADLQSEARGKPRPRKPRGGEAARPNPGKPKIELSEACRTSPLGC